MIAKDQRSYRRGEVSETIPSLTTAPTSLPHAAQTSAGNLPYTSAAATGGETGTEVQAGTADRTTPPLMSNAAKKALWRSASEGLTSIAIQPDVMKGKPTVRGTRVAVSQVLGALADYGAIEPVLEQYPGVLSREDVHDVLAFASRLVR